MFRVVLGVRDTAPEPKTNPFPLLLAIWLVSPVMTTVPIVTELKLPLDALTDAQFASTPPRFCWLLLAGRMSVLTEVDERLLRDVLAPPPPPPPLWVST